MRKAAVFIDGGYLDVVQRRRDGIRIDLHRLSDAMVGPSAERIRTYYYHCLPYVSPRATEPEARRYGASRQFFETLRHLPRFEVRLGELARRDGGFEQKGVDVLLSVDLVRMSWGGQIDIAALLTGDSDFVPALRAAKDAGVVTRLFFDREAVHNELLKTCDDRVELTRALLESVARPPSSGAPGQARK